ncbi:MAG: Gfo/Idh/MocA family oxidoreductase [Pirellulales bacterium]|nr:Gfo/Idh/MocA family oxidoreductase [Pirellulales bacterium]
MHLSPEEKAVGKENFLTTVGTTRRNFLKGTLATGATTGASLGAMYYGYGAKIENRLRIGIIGTGDEGNVLIGALNPEYVDVVAIADIRPYNIYRAFHGDYSSPAAKAVRPGLLKVYEKVHGWKSQNEAQQHITVYSDEYEKLLADPNVEGVIIALPLWLHKEAAIKAMRAGKHVLTEKLMASTVGQCKEMARVAAQENKLLATGHQRHYSILYANAVDQIERGLIGDIHHIRAQWHRGNLPGKDSWQPPLPTKMMTEDDYKNGIRQARADGREAEYKKEHGLLGKLYSLQSKAKAARLRRKETEAVQFDNYAKQVAEQLTDFPIDAAKYGYMEKTLEGGTGRKVSPLEELIRWRLWERTGAGLMAELGSHQLDAASIFISAQHGQGKKVRPLSVVGSGSRSIFPADREVDDHVYTMFEFPAPGYFRDGSETEVADPNKKIVVTYSSINGNGFGGYGEVVMGTKGTLILEREKEVMLFKGSNTSTSVQVTEGKDGPQLDTTESGYGPPAALAQAALPADVSRGYQEQIEHWAWCIRNPSPENQPKCKPEVAMADAIIALTSNLAMKENRRIEFKPEWFDIQSDETPEGIPPQPLDELA